MEILDRTKSPEYKQVDAFNSLHVEKHTLKNGIPVYLLNSGIQQVVKVDFIFEAGQWFCENPLVSDYSNQLMIEGSSMLSSSEIADKFDFYGTFTNFECGKHFANAQLYTLSHFFEKSIEVFRDIIKNATYPEKEFKVQIQNEFQQFILSREKTEVMAADEFYPKLFGTNHPYGKVRKAADFENLEISQLRTFHKMYYCAENCKIVVSGKLNDEIISILDVNFGGGDWKRGTILNRPKVEQGELNPGRYIVRKAGAAQSSIKLGTVTIDKKHNDFHALSVLNTILGGYFGSRLMTNLREKNALTYGIYSNLISFMHNGIFVISANVNSNFAIDAIEHIYKEIDILKNDLVSEEELKMVKNYLSGSILRAFDGPLLQSEIYAGLLNYQLDFDFYQRYFNTLKTIRPETLRDLANTYFRKENFVEILVGNFD